MKDGPIVHKYLLYNGPVKVGLLSQLEGDKAVPEDLVQRYKDDLKLKTLTDYHSNGWFGEVAGTIGWTRLLVGVTNLMHEFLWRLHHHLHLSYGLCIIFLTILVRALMFPLSRKQTLAGQAMQDKMQRMKPELAKLQEKYKDDPDTLKMEQMKLYRKYGINPLGTCWVALLQMPIFMGLYFALQESIHFRLAPFWPLWIDNLAAPDMLFYWSESIPLISSPANYSGFWSFLYLGPFFSLLPVIAVGFMILQQSLMMAPPADEQQATQQKMMKYMTILFGLFFYKVAAGLCVYFIASSLWGFTERKLIGKKKPGTWQPSEKEGGGLFGWVLKRMEPYRPQRGAVPALAGAAPAPGSDSPATTGGGEGVGPGPTSDNIKVGAAPEAQPSRSRRKERRHKRKQRRGEPGAVSARRTGGDTPGSTGGGSFTSDGSRQDGEGAFHKVRGALNKVRAWWQEVLKQAQKKER